MTSTYCLRKIRGGFTLTEACLALFFVSVIVLGTLGFSYHGRLDARKADLYNTSTNLAEVILNDWKAAGGRSSYDPIASLSKDFTITASEAGPTGVDGLVGRYEVLLDGNSFRVALSYHEAGDDKPKMLNVVVSWIEHSEAWDDSTDPRQWVKLSGYVLGK